MTSPRDLIFKPGTILSPRRSKPLSENQFNIKPKFPPDNSPKGKDPRAEERTRNLTRPFVLKEKLAEGSYGVVYKAAYCQTVDNPESPNVIDHTNIKETNELLAVKIMTNQKGITPINGSSIGPLVEIDIMSRLRHPNLLAMSQITIVDFITPTMTILGSHPRTTLAISMPLAISNLADYMLERKKNGNELPLATKIGYIKQILAGVDYLHAEQILHLDIKLENVLLLSPNHVVIADFGLSIYTDQVGCRKFNRESITITYRPPELFKNSTQFERSADVWSLGMLSLFLLTGVKHIFPDVKKSSVKTQLALSFNDNVRTITLHRYLQPSIPSLSQRTAVINFLNRLLPYNPSNRCSTKDLLGDPIFQLPGLPRPICRNPTGTSFYPLIWIHPPEEIGLEPYLSIDFLIRLMSNINPSIETYFIAIDFFHRSLAHLYVLRGYFKGLSIGPWKEDCSLTEMISLGALTSVWIALKVNDHKKWDAKSMSDMTSGHYSPHHILEMERQLVTGLKGVIYRWNLFKEAKSSADLVRSLELTTNIYQYPHISPNRDQSVLTLNNFHQTSFNSIYCLTQFYKESRGVKSEDFAKRRFDRDRQNYFLQHRTNDRTHRLIVNISSPGVKPRGPVIKALTSSSDLTQ